MLHLRDIRAFRCFLPNNIKFRLNACVPREYQRAKRVANRRPVRHVTRTIIKKAISHRPIYEFRMTQPRMQHFRLNPMYNSQSSSTIISVISTAYRGFVFYSPIQFHRSYVGNNDHRVCGWLKLTSANMPAA